jgi:CubicO group peptidase (beta-lactamase class C family)
MLYATLASLCILAQVAPPSNSIDEQIDRFVRGEMAAQHIPGAAVAVIKNGVTLRAEGYGVANIEHCVPAQRESVFQSGSLGKQFTAAGIMMLVERDKLDLNDPIARHLPSPARWGSITVRHLLTHTSGLPDDEFVLNLRRDYTENELALFTASLPRRYRPGKHFQYSNLGYALLGMIIGRVSGQFYGDFLRENIFIPAGMHTTRIISEADIVPGRVAGYRLVAKQIKNQEWVAPSHNTTADGALHVTLLDLIAWERVVRTRALLSAESWSKMFQPATLLNGRKSSYGFAWELERQGGKDIHYHDGSWQGFETLLIRYVDDNLSVIILANLADAELRRLADRIAAIVNGEASRGE